MRQVNLRRMPVGVKKRGIRRFTIYQTVKNTLQTRPDNYKIIGLLSD